MPFGLPTRWLRCAGCVAGLACLAAACCGRPVLAASTPSTAKAGSRTTQKKVVALSPWEQAERGRETLEAIADADRTKADYARAMDLYRAIYHANPRDGHAPAAVNAVAEMLAEQGRGLHDAASSKAAVGQYEFLRKQYPGSSLGVQALLAEGQIEQNDLSDAAAAKDRYKLLLKEHGKSEQAEEARAGLASLGQQGSGSRVQGSGKAASVAAAKPVVVEPTHRERAAVEIPPEVVAPAAVVPSPVSSPAVSSTASRTGTSALPAMALTSGAVTGAAMQAASQSANRPGPAVVPAAGNAGPATVDRAAVDAETMPAGGNAGPRRSGNKALVTGIRHWSTATYTRVAIDLGDNVTFEAARVPNPDRIYFDLHGTKLAAELAGKSFAVTDDGFLKKIRAAQSSDDTTRVVLDVNDVSEYSAFLLPNPYRLIIDIHGSKEQGPGLRAQGSVETAPAPVAPPVEVPVPRVAAVVKATTAKPVPNTVATKSPAAEVADLSLLPGRVEATSKPTSKPIAAVTPVDLGTAAPDPAAKKVRKGKTAFVADATPARAAVPTADGETSLVRALGLKIGRIVIDAGHGGHDSGTLGVDGIQEKDVVLDVALRLGKMLHDRLGAEIIYTRSDDTFIPLETRTAIANKAQADLFLSIHANSSPDASARGVETYYLNFTSDPTALDVAARENAVSDQSIHQLSDLVKKIALKDKISESREFAADVEGSLYAGLTKGNEGLKNRGVKKAPFVVLIGANMPSILAEISFVTNAKDAGQLREPDYRQRVAESLYKGVARYEGGLSGTRAPVERAAGQ